jgi:hypothetical protein
MKTYSAKPQLSQRILHFKLERKKEHHLNQEKPQSHLDSKRNP